LIDWKTSFWYSQTISCRARNNQRQKKVVVYDW